MIDPRTSLRELHKAAKGVVDSIANTPESFEAYRNLGIEVTKLDQEFMHQIPDECLIPQNGDDDFLFPIIDLSGIEVGDRVEMTIKNCCAPVKGEFLGVHGKTVGVKQGGGEQWVRPMAIERVE